MFEFSRFTCGNPRHPPLIFLHGFLGAKEDWKEILSFFENHYFCIALDLPGHGSTSFCDQILSKIKSEIEKISTIKPALIGYSLGGRIALQLQEIASAIVVLSAHPGLKTSQEKEERRKIDESWIAKILEMPWEVFLAEWYAQPVFQALQHKPSFLKKIIEKRLNQNPKDLALVLRQLSLANQPLIDHFSSPALFLYGEEDLKYRELYSRLPKNVQVRGIQNCGHAIHLENAAACAHEIFTWLNCYANS